LAASRSVSEASITALPADVPRRDPSSCLVGSRTLRHDPKGALGHPQRAGSVWIKALRLRALIPRASLRDRCLVSRARQTLPGPAPGDPTYFDVAILIVRTCVRTTCAPPCVGWKVSLAVSLMFLCLRLAFANARLAERVGLIVIVTTPGAGKVCLPRPKRMFAGRQRPASLIRPARHFLLLAVYA